MSGKNNHRAAVVSAADKAVLRAQACGRYSVPWCHNLRTSASKSFSALPSDSDLPEEIGTLHLGQDRKCLFDQVVSAGKQSGRDRKV